ncbi:IclR family transcriptional regulator [Mycobacterium sp. IDR2000157661]|uniref:IclR family transcriptional regulator n=1 Tax=Mycobacterium sp. IDR2000157661 TaxID=2867005 RepID=UPI001EEB4B35|nr:helix-turn-helix domain-containing protein [Mycobacterium sp. IDR2000157661]
MTGVKVVAASTSPPTQRVVAVIEFLTVRDRPHSAAEIADGLDLSRSTAGAILSELDHKGWVIRQPDLTYRLGPALIAISERVRPALPHPAEVDAELDRLAERVGCAVGLSTVHRDQMIVVAVAIGSGRIPAGIASGTRVPLAPPAGAATVAYADTAMQKAWLARGAREDHARLAHLLNTIRDTGVGIWGVGAASIDTVDVIADVVSFLSDSPAGTGLRDRVAQLLSNLNGMPYTPEELAVNDDLPVSVLTTPVFDSGRRAQWELQIGPFRAAVPRKERERYVHELTSTARRLTEHRG